MSTFAEGVESIRFACSLVLVIPAIGVLLLGRRRAVLVAVWVAVSTLVAWLRFVGWWGLDTSGLWHVVAGIALVAAAAVAFRLDRLDADVGVTALLAVVSTWTWVPCVGSELGEILNEARDAPWSQLLPTIVFMVGHFLPFVLVAAASVALPDVAARVDRPSVRVAGLGLVALVGALVAATLLDDLAGELARRSTW